MSGLCRDSSVGFASSLALPDTHTRRLIRRLITPAEVNFGSDLAIADFA